MPIESPFESEGIWLRCALHAHTTNSDGELAPPRLAAHYARAGYDALCITDHWVRTVEADADGLLVIPGTELNATIDGTESDAHVLGLGIGADPVEPGRRFPSLQATVDWILEEGGLPFLAHPYWSGLRPEEFAGCAGLLGLEVYNAGCDLETGRGLSAVHWDESLEAGESSWRSRPTTAISPASTAASLRCGSASPSGHERQSSTPSDADASTARQARGSSPSA